MDIVETSTTPAYPIGADPAGAYRSGPGPFPALRRLTPNTLALALFVLGFVLVLGAQLTPWIRLDLPARYQPPVADTPSTLNMLDAGLIMVPYYLVWISVFVCCGALLYTENRRRRVLFGAAAGLLAAQVLIVVPVLQKPSILWSVYLVDSAKVKATHALGSYLVVAAFLAIAAGLVVAVRGRILPEAPSSGPAAPMVPAQPELPYAEAERLRAQRSEAERFEAQRSEAERFEAQGYEAQQFGAQQREAERSSAGSPTAGGWTEQAPVGEALPGPVTGSSVPVEMPPARDDSLYRRPAAEGIPIGRHSQA